jgi:diguanylate cyclase (GGDEF)-like protein/PAS domain S-box-containing protein
MDTHLGQAIRGGVRVPEQRAVTDRFDPFRDQSLQLVMNHAPVAMNLASPEGELLRVNPAMCAFLGRDEKTLLNTKWQALTHPHDLGADMALVRDVLAGVRDSYRISKRFIRPDGTVVWGDLSVAGVRDEQGRVIYLIAQILDITELVRNREELADSREQYRMLAEYTSDVVMQVAATGEIEWASASVAATFGWDRDEVVGRSIADFVSDEDHGVIGAALDRGAEEGTDATGTFRVLQRGGHRLWVQATASSVWDSSGRLVRIVRLRDVDAEVHAQIELRDSEERFRTAMRATPLGMALITRGGTFLQVNAALCRMLHSDEKALLGASITSLTHEGDRSVDLEMWNLLHSGQVSSVTREKRLMAADGSVVWVQNALAAVKDLSGADTSFVAQFLDITQARSAQESLQVLAHKDPLTNLWNRRAILAQIQDALSRDPRNATSKAVLYCDLDDFKPINDRHGHAVGDALLVEVARRIEACVPDPAVVGRIGGDEFLIFLPSCEGPPDALDAAECIRRAVGDPVGLDGSTMRVSISLGVGFAAPGDDADALIAKADRALYSAKRMGRDRVVV